MSRTFRLGLFIVGALAILATGIFLIGDKELLFSSTYRLKSTFKTVIGLSNGAQVRVGGIHQGTVRQIQLPKEANGEMVVVMDLDKSTREVIKKDSVASIQTEGLLGNKFVEISFGSEDQPKVEAGDTIRGEPPLDISDLIDKANEILDSTKESTSELAEISGKINEGKGTLGALVNDRKMYEEMNVATAEAKQGAAAFRENMQALKSNFFLRGFFNRRGYRDSSELTKYEIARLPSQPAMKTFAYDPVKLFEKPDTAKLKNEKVLNDAGAYLQRNPFGLAVVRAAAGMKGNTEENEVLTQARAMVVRDYLVKTFPLDDTRIKTIGLGEAEEAGTAGEVEIVVYPTGVKAPASAERASGNSNGHAANASKPNSADAGRSLATASERGK